MYTQSTRPDRGLIRRRNRVLPATAQFTNTQSLRGLEALRIQHWEESRNGHPELQFPWNGASWDMRVFWSAVSA